MNDLKNLIKTMKNTKNQVKKTLGLEYSTKGKFNVVNPIYISCV